MYTVGSEQTFAEGWQTGKLTSDCSILPLPLSLGDVLFYNCSETCLALQGLWKS